MRLRKLESKDAILMYEWMHDENVIGKIQRDKFLHKTLEDCEEFISDAQDDNGNIHRAVVDDSDQYLGTVSLKNVDMEKKQAEFAITIRSSAMGTGASGFAMREILRYGFDTVGIEEIYWYVKADNARAIRFYEKGKCEKISESIANKYLEKKMDDTLGELQWFRILKGEL